MSVPVPHSRVLEKIVAINSNINVKLFINKIMKYQSFFIVASFRNLIFVDT